MKRMIAFLFSLFVLMTTLVGCNEERGLIASVEQMNDPQYTIGYEEGQSAGTILLQTHPKAKLKVFWQ